MEPRAIQYQPWEAAFLPTDAPADPYRDGFLRVEITDAYGDVRWREGFWDGGVWRVRWMPLEDGPHHLRIETNLGGLPESLGIVVEAAAPPDPAFRHALSASGPVRIADDRTRFARHDGTPFFLKCEEVYTVPSRATDGEWAFYCAQRARVGFTGASLSTDGARFFGPREGDEPPAFRPDLAHLARLDRRLATMNAHGLVAVLRLFRLVTIDHPLNIHGGTDLDDVVSVAEAIRLGRYLAARWGAFDALWHVGLPGGREDDEALVLATRGVGRGIFGDDPWRAPVAVALGARDLLHPALDGEAWLGWIAARTHGGWIKESLRWLWSEYAADAPTGGARPRVNLDPVVYGEQWEPGDPESARSARHLVYSSLFAVPSAGAGYTMRAIHDWRRPGSTPTADPGSTWIEALGDASTIEFGRIDETLSKHHWPDLSPARELLAEARAPDDPIRTIGVLANSDRSLVRAYVPRRMRFRLPGLAGTYAAYWVDLRSSRADIPLPDAGSATEFEPPTDDDWILELDAH